MLWENVGNHVIRKHFCVRCLGKNKKVNITLYTYEPLNFYFKFIFAL